VRIAIYAIAKNESAHVERFLASAGEADLVLVADTGSTDDTVARLRRGGAVVHEIAVTPWRFDVARNRTLGLLPDDIDLCISLDLDEVLMPGWRAAAEAAWQPGVTRLRYHYVSSHGPDGAPAIEHMLAKAHARHGYHWQHAVHEDVEPIAPEAEVVAEAFGLRVDHLPDPEKPRSDYLPLLELVAHEEPDNDRHAFWLGREYLYAERWEDALAECVRYLALPSAIWEPERAAAMRYLAEASAALGRTQEAEGWLLRACAEAPDEREPWVDLAQSCHDRGDWAGCLAAAERALAIAERPHHYLTTDLAWGERPHDLAAIGAWWLGAHDLARERITAALRLAPDDPRLVANAELMGVDR
jgi:tetratricopeptide (TPR) repeat protein